MANIGIVGIDHDKALITHMIEYVTNLSPLDVVYTVDRGEFNKEVVVVARKFSNPVVIMESEKHRFGVAADMKRNVALAKEIDTLVVFWDFHDMDVNSMLTMAKLYGKKILVNPHEAGGIVTPSKGDVAQQVEASGSNPEAVGSNPTVPTTEED